MTAYATKRCFDILASTLGLVALSPLLLVIALLVRLDSPGPVLFRQRRVGRDAKPFQIYKFRTMVHAAGQNGARITLNKDVRVTRVGRVLRRFDLDELPTLFNVLRGEMSIVGPRPEVPQFLPLYTDEQKRVFSVKPGLTDPATLAFRAEASRLAGSDAEAVYAREILPAKLALNLRYIERRSFACDLKIIVRTVAAVLFQRKE